MRNRRTRHNIYFSLYAVGNNLDAPGVTATVPFLRVALVFSMLPCAPWNLVAQTQTNWATLTVDPLSTEIAFHAKGVPGSLYRLETSVDLANWSTVSLAINETGDLLLRAPAPEGSAASLYRLLIDSPAHRVTEEYCRRAAVVSPKAKLDLFRFCDGVEALGLLTNLADFAFFCEGMQPTEGEPVSWRNTGQIAGTIDRLRGGFALPNYLTTNHFYFTNLPPTPNGRTLVLWAAGNMNRCGVLQDVDVALIELAAAGPWLQPMLQMFYSAGGYQPYNWNGSVQSIGPSWYGYSGYENALFCLGLASSASGYAFTLIRDETPDDLNWAGPDGTAVSPAVIRFGSRSFMQPQSAWNGLYRGFAYFNIALSPSRIRRIDSLLPRVGVVIEGDSKSVFGPVPQLYYQFWLNIPPTWGLYSLRTNSARSGTQVAMANSPLHNSMEDRFPAVAALRTNAQFPLMLYSLRGGHNDFINQARATQTAIDNAFTAITNLWAEARSNGFKTVGWTIDRTAVTWSGGSPGNSNLLTSLNARLRELQNNCDYFVDNELWCVTNFGETPFTNTCLYSDGVHDAIGAGVLGTNMLGGYAWPSLGYEGD